jgi:hypothetical protein
MSKQRRQATSAVQHTATPSAGNGEARPNGQRSAQRDAHEGTGQARRHTSRTICRGFHHKMPVVRSGEASPQRLRVTLNPHRDRRTA